MFYNLNRFIGSNLLNLKITLQIYLFYLHLRANYCSLKALRTYAIPFTGLKLGKHEFDYVITDAFFNDFEYSLVKQANLHCKVELEKQETMLIMNFGITGVIELNCDKCLAAYPHQVNLKEQQIAKFSDELIDEDEEVITLTKNDHEINIAGLIYEYINVAVPFIAICSSPGDTLYCDKDMLDRLNQLSAGEEQVEPQTDPRWEALKNIK